MDEHAAITDRRMLIASMVVLAGIVAGFLFQRQTGLAPSVVALIGAGVLTLLSPLHVGELLRDVEWETLAFFMGLFVMIGALVRVGALEQLANAIAGITGGETAPTLMLVLGGSAGSLHVWLALELVNADFLDRFAEWHALQVDPAAAIGG